VEQIIRKPKPTEDPLILLVEESAALAAMLFGDQPGGKSALRKVEKRISKILNHPQFSVSDLVRHTFETDENVKDFFNLSAEDVEIMVNILEWGKANPMEIVSHMDFGAALDCPAPVDTPESLIGHFLTELALCRRRGGELNQLLMLAQEALFRCLPDSEIFIAFLSADKKREQDRFYVGSTLHVNAQDFCVSLNNYDSAIVECLRSPSSGHWQAGAVGLGLPYTPFGHMPFRCAYLSPIVARNQAIGLCFAGRLKGDGFNERECVWIDQIVDQIAGELTTIRESEETGSGLGNIIKK
jgi:hypothetical protein